MAETKEDVQDAETPPKKKSKLPLILGVVLAVAGGTGGFMAVQKGLLGGGESSADAGQGAGHGSDHKAAPPRELPQLAFVPLDPMVISLPGGGRRFQLRFSAQLEVDPGYQRDVETLRPRITDVLNSYLRAVNMAELEDPTALSRLRSQMLRRIQIVTGEGRVKDLLIMEFVMN